jgi:hypothetical protein
MLASRMTGFDETIEEKEDMKGEIYCPYHKTKTCSLNQCKKFNELPFEEMKDFLFKNSQTSISPRSATRCHLNVVFVRRSI